MKLTVTEKMHNLYRNKKNESWKIASKHTHRIWYMTQWNWRSVGKHRLFNKSRWDN